MLVLSIVLLAGSNSIGPWFWGRAHACQTGWALAVNYLVEIGEPCDRPSGPQTLEDGGGFNHLHGLALCCVQLPKVGLGSTKPG